MKTKIFIAVLALAGMLLSTVVAAQQKAVPDGWNINFTIDYCKEMQKGDEKSFAANCLGAFVTQMLALRDDNASRFGNIDYRYDVVYQRKADDIDAEHLKWVFGYDEIVPAQKSGKIRTFATNIQKNLFNDTNSEWLEDPCDHFLNISGNFNKGKYATDETNWDDYIKEKMLYDSATLARKNTIYIFCVYKMPYETGIRELNAELKKVNSFCIFLQTNQKGNIGNEIKASFTDIKERLLPQDTSKVKIEQVGGSISGSAPGEYSWELKGTEDLKNVTGYEWFINDKKLADGKTCKARLEDQGKYDVVAKISFFNGETVPFSRTYEIRDEVKYNIQLRIDGEVYKSGKETIKINPGTRDLVEAVFVLDDPERAKKNLKAELKYHKDGTSRILEPLPEKFQLPSGKSGKITILDKRTNERVSEFWFSVRESKGPNPPPPPPGNFEVKSVTVDGEKLPEKDGVYQAEITDGSDSVKICVEVTGAKYFIGTVTDQSTVKGEDGKWSDNVPVGRHKITFEYNRKFINITVNVTKKEPNTPPPPPGNFEVKSVTVDGEKLPEKDGVYQAEITDGSDSVKICVEVTGAKDFNGTVTGQNTAQGKNGKWSDNVPVGTHDITFEYNGKSISITVNVTKKDTNPPPPPPKPEIKVESFTADGKDIYPSSDGKTYQVTLEKGKKEAEIELQLIGAENIKVSVNYGEKEDIEGGTTWTYKAEKGTTDVEFSAENIGSLMIRIEVEEAKTPAKAPASPSADEAEGGSNILLIVLIVGAVIVVGCIVLFKQLGNKVFKISLNDLPYNKALAPGEYKIDSSMFPDCQESFTIILSTKKGEDGTGHYVQFKLMPNWTLFEGNRALPLNGECSDELQINTETYKIRTLKGTMEFKIDLKD